MHDVYNKAYDESMCNKHAITGILNLKREDIDTRSCQILHNLGVVGAHHETSAIIIQFCGAILPFVFNK